MVTIHRMGRDKDESKYKLVVKGAPEVVMPMISSYVDPQNNQEISFQNQTSYYLQSIVSQRLGINGQEPLTYAFKMLSRKEFDDLVFNNEFSLDSLHDLRLLATFGLKDRCRDNILEQVREI